VTTQTKDDSGCTQVATPTEAEATSKGTTDMAELRKRIDAIDTQILTLINDRAGCAIEVGEYKKQHNLEFYAPEREQQVLEALGGKNKGPFPTPVLRHIFREIMSASLSLEKPLRIAFLGPPATFTHQAGLQHFGLSGEFLPRKDIAEVFSEVERGKADYGVVPVESTAEGAVDHTLDLLVSSKLKICSEVMLEVTSSLLNKTGDIKDIKKICSHPHALAQCSKWLREKLSGIPIVEVSSTATAARMAEEDKSVAAIAGQAAANMYGLRVVEDGIENVPNNYTRFLVIGTKECGKTGKDKTSVVCSIKDGPGALSAMLAPFASRDINLTKIESRPLKTKAWEYVFLLDIEGHATDAKVKEALLELEGLCSFFKVLGSYPKAK